MGHKGLITGRDASDLQTLIRIRRLWSGVVDALLALCAEGKCIARSRLRTTKTDDWRQQRQQTSCAQQPVPPPSPCELRTRAPRLPPFSRARVAAQQPGALRPGIEYAQRYPCSQMVLADAFVVDSPNVRYEEDYITAQYTCVVS